MKRTTLMLLLCMTVGLVAAKSYYFTRIDNTSGLSNNQIECIFKDSRGYMWFGTNYGLNRYDGYQMKVYKSDRNDSTTLTHNTITGIQEDEKGNLWMKSLSDYVIYDSKKDQFIRNISSVLKPLGISFIPSIVEIDLKKNYYFYQPNVGVFKYNISTKQIQIFHQGIGDNNLSQGTITAVHSTKNAFWVYFESGLLERFNELTNRVDIRDTYVKNNMAGSSIAKNLYVDNDGCPWIYPGMADKGVLCFDPSLHRWTYFGNNKNELKRPHDVLITTNFVRDVVQEKNGDVWIATDHGGICIFNKKTHQINTLLNDPQNPNTISQNSVITLFADNDGIVWVGTYKNGVAYYHPDIFKFEKSPLFFYNNPKLKDKDCNNLREDSNGNLWIGTNGGGLIKYNMLSETFQLFVHDANDPTSISSDIIISSLQDHKGELWFGTFLGGLNRYQNGKFKRYLPEENNLNSLSNKCVYGLLEDSQNNIWIGTLGGGIDKLDSTRTLFKRNNVANSPGLSSNYIVSLFSKDKENIYISSSFGLDMLNTTVGSIQPAIPNSHIRNELSDFIANNILLDIRNLLWIATDNGINVYNYKKNQLTHLDKSNGLKSDQVVSLIEDNDGKIWAGTRNGLACIYCSKDSITDKYEFSIINFDENDGLESAVFNPNATFKNKEGKLYFGGTQGFTVFDPKSIEFNNSTLRPQFTGLMIDNEEIRPTVKYNNRIILDKSITYKHKIVLNYNENNVSVLFSAMNYIHLEKNLFKYKLKGVDHDWRVTKNGIVSYSNLNSGNYELIIYASNNDKVWSAEPLVLEIVVCPPFWFSWWAMILYVLLTLFCVWAFIRYILLKQQRKFEDEQRAVAAQQLHEMDEMKFRFFTNISHEFRTPLTLILNPVEILLQIAQSNEEKNLLSIIQRNATSLLELVNQLLDFRRLDLKMDSLNPTVVDIIAFVKDICYSFSDLANNKLINFSFSSSITELHMELDAEKMRKIVSNLLSNAFKFTPDKGEIDVHISVIQPNESSSNFLKIVVKDSGCGISIQDQQRIFERFYRVEEQENGHQTGTGIGLHIVSEYVKMHNGEVSVSSEPHKGTAFTVLIPVLQQMHEELISVNLTDDEETEDVQKSEVELSVSQQNHTGLKKKNLPMMLIVDDNKDFRNFVAAFFADLYQIFTASDGEEALQITLDNTPDLIISDVMMPAMNGYEFCQKVKEDIRISHIPIILLTAKTGDENKYTGLKAGAEDYISKPFKMEMLALKVERLIERQRKVHEQFNKKITITTSEIVITSLDEKFVEKAVALVESRIGNTDFSVEDLCREMGISRVYFYKKILSLTDKTPSEFIRFIRLKRAADLLEKSQLYVNEIMFQVGFNDPKNFRKYFKNEFGLSPNDYKKQFMPKQ